MLDFIRDPLNRFLKQPQPDRFLELRYAYEKSSIYTPYENYKASAFPLLDREQYSEALEYLLSVLPKWFLNPGIHHVLAYTNHKLARTDEESLENKIAQLLLYGILSSGNGSEVRPYLILYVDDEYEVLESLGKKSRLQQLIEKNACSFDVQICQEGDSIWFDATTPRNRLAKMLGTKK
jgi:hypothetical protein